MSLGTQENNWDRALNPFVAYAEHEHLPVHQTYSWHLPSQKQRQDKLLSAVFMLVFQPPNQAISSLRRANSYDSEIKLSLNVRQTATYNPRFEGWLDFPLLQKNPVDFLEKWMLLNCIFAVLRRYAAKSFIWVFGHELQGRGGRGKKKKKLNYEWQQLETICSSVMPCNS